jgi:hypothetical protein
LREDRPLGVPLEVALQLIGAVKIAADDAGIWDSAVVAALVKSHAASSTDGLVVYVRELEAADTARTRGRLSGPEIALLRARAPTTPSLALLYVGSPAAPDGWFPTLVMPAKSPAFVFEGA